MDVLLLTFANSRTNPLPTLAGEYAELSKRLWPRALRQHYLACPVSHATLDDVAYYLTLFRNRLSLFLFSGHAHRDALITEDGAARADGIAHLLAQCPNLKVVVLNGCSTVGQVEALHRAGVPLVIATSAPVGDEIAAKFSERLFQALETGLTIGEAFEQAIGEAQARQPLNVERGPAPRSESRDNEPLWGIKPHPDKPDAAGWKLPTTPVKTALQYHEPNEVLLETLYHTLAETNPKLRELRDAGAEMDTRQEEIISALLRALPAPLSEHVRKLVAPSTPGATGGWDQVGQQRLAQMVQTYQICMDFLLYTLLAQVWEDVYRKGLQWRPAPALLRELRFFLELDAAARRDCDYFSVIRLLREALDQAGETPFIVEYVRLREDFMANDAVKDACFFLEALRRQSESAGLPEMTELCARAEESLAVIFGKLGFLGRYQLATVRNIDVLKYRRTNTAAFKHMVVKWHGTLGYYQKEYPVLPNVMDNRSVVLLRLGEGPEAHFLNLSPFILDENTFEKVPDTSLSKLYFFAWQQQGRLRYKYVNEPEHDVIDLDDPEFFDRKEKTNKFQAAKAQFEAFYKAVFDEKPNPAAP
ncbi:MAG: CHAT domain-containing protein [Saprospiraceae bacterium]|nr:CHAT domain-containing protein [Saprospiraceae bacterium]